MKYEVLNHACVRIEGEKTIYTDPFGLENAPHDADIIFITHDHYDHLSPEDIEKVAKPETVLVMPKTVEYASEWRSVKLQPEEKASVEGIAVEAVRAYNPNKKFHPKENDWLGFVITLDGIRFYVAGDTDDTPEARAVSCDVAFLPVGGTYTCTAEEAAELAKAIAPAREAVPYHCGSIVGTKDDAVRFLSLIR